LQICRYAHAPLTMYLTKLDIRDVRNLKEVQMECSPGLNIISGKNAAGKTAILEGIHILARISSFRTPRINDVIQYGKQQLSVSARINDDLNNKFVTGLEKSRQTTKIRFNGSNVYKRSEQARNLPVLTVSPESHRLLSGAPRERRHWLDWSMFHVEPAYMEHWQKYHHALRHRNALLRSHANQAQFDVWEELLANTSFILRKFRKNYIDKLNNSITDVANGHIGKININLHTEEADQETIRNNLKQQRPSDIMLGHTQQGPHREDLVFNVNNRDAGKTLSRGEGKMFVLFLFLTQALEYISYTSQQPILLIDDLAAELDKEARKNVLNRLKCHGLQTFITTTERGLLEIVAEPHSWFHVEQGNITNKT
jgi:DNA replication and repair protein RecF